METTAESLDELQNKIDWEGGLWDYVIGYGGPMPKELVDEANALKAAATALEVKFDALLNEYGVEPL